MLFVCYISIMLLFYQKVLGCEDKIESISRNRLRKSIGRNVDGPQYSQNSYNINSKVYTLKEWPKRNVKLGGVNGVAVDDDDFVYVFHRHDRVWSSNTFNVNNEFLQSDLGPISAPTILVFDRNGTLVQSRGKAMFYMPHGISLDKHKNIWITDVALHQIMKLPSNSDVPLLTLGKAFKPGRDTVHFCKPTSVAVLRDTDDFFVADGYCNYRILKFNFKGVKLLEWGRSSANMIGHVPGHYEFFIPHALTVVEDKGLICVADRQNGRVLCYHANNGTYVSTISNPSVIGSYIYSIAYSPHEGGQMFLVNGQTGFKPVEGFSVSLDNTITSRFGGDYLQYSHDIAVTPDSSAIYIAELNPPRVSKFVKEVAGNGEKLNNSSFIPVIKVQNPPKGGKIAGAVLVIASCFVFAVAIIIATFIYTRSKKAGCGRCRNNFWLKNSRGEGFKLGNILGHEGFQQLNQGAESDEEHVLA